MLNHHDPRGLRRAILGPEPPYKKIDFYVRRQGHQCHGKSPERQCHGKSLSHRWHGKGPGHQRHGKTPRHQFIKEEPSVSLKKPGAAKSLNNARHQCHGKILSISVMEKSSAAVPWEKPRASVSWKKSWASTPWRKNRASASRKKSGSALMHSSPPEALEGVHVHLAGCM